MKRELSLLVNSCTVGVSSIVTRVAIRCVPSAYREMEEPRDWERIEDSVTFLSGERAYGSGLKLIRSRVCLGSVEARIRSPRSLALLIS